MDRILGPYGSLYPSARLSSYPPYHGKRILLPEHYPKYEARFPLVRGRRTERAAHIDKRTPVVYVSRLGRGKGDHTHI